MVRVDEFVMLSPCAHASTSPLFYTPLLSLLFGPLVLSFCLTPRSGRHVPETVEVAVIDMSSSLNRETEARDPAVNLKCYSTSPCDS